jgi:arginyl-tRNA synthetase
LNIKNLTERGESFYQPIIPDVLKLLEQKGLIKDEQGAKIILLDNWTYPLMVVKSDGGYTYDTTDLAALYHRTMVLGADQIVYITDAGQKTHFDMCFEIADKMGWLDTQPSAYSDGKRKLKHIGFGLVCGKDGKKLKTRSGETVNMMDVIEDVINLSQKVITDRIKMYTEKSDSSNENKKDTDEGAEYDSTSSYYQHLTLDGVKDMSRKIGINTLKYFDLSHNYETNYKYDPVLMFRFNGDTGVYLMYCYARINGIIEKSTLGEKVKHPISFIGAILADCSNDSYVVDESYFTKDTRDLFVHILNIGKVFTNSVESLDTNLLTKYIYTLCTMFNKFITQKNGKIIRSSNERSGIAMCWITSKIIENIFNILSFEPVPHI